jgi:putative ABC transport system permease protein
MLLLAGFAGMALLLAGVGLYGVVAGAVAQRTREIGVRVALGAQYVDVVRLVMRRGARLVALGLAIGVASSLALGRFVSSLLYEITPRDPLTLVGAATFLAVVALVAAFIPARRAARLDPMVALRTE